MITDVVVVGAVALAVAFSVAWALRPDLRAWVERPKHRLDERLRAFDAALGPQQDGGRR